MALKIEQADEFMESIATWGLRLIGLLWLFGGLFVIREVLRWSPLEDALDQVEALIEQEGLDEEGELGEAVADPGRNRWMLVGGVLTAVTGGFLLWGDPWLMAPLTLLLLHQVAYVRRQDNKVSAAQTEEGAEIAAMSRSAWRAARFTVIVWGAAALLHGRAFLAVVKGLVG